MQTIALPISLFLGTDVIVTIVFLCNNMTVFAWPVSLGLIMRWYRYVNIICTLHEACTFNLSYTGLSCNRYFHSPTISLITDPNYFLFSIGLVSLGLALCSNDGT
jgi:hypothetical protein